MNRLLTVLFVWPIVVFAQNGCSILNNGWLGCTVLPLTCQSGQSASVYLFSNYSVYDCIGNVYMLRNTPGQLANVPIPGDFTPIGVSFYRDAQGNYSSSFNVSNYVNAWGNINTIYVDPVSGNDSTGNGTSANPYKSLNKGVTIAQANAPTSVQITIVTHSANVKIYGDNSTGFAGSGHVYALSGQKLYMTTDNPSYVAYVTAGQSAPSWSLTGGTSNCYQAALTNVTGVIDLSSLDAHNVPSGYTLETSTATVDSNAGSWWSDGTNVYVHALGGGTPTNGTVIVLRAFDVSLKFTLANSSQLVVSNMQFLGTGGNADPNAYIQNASGDFSNNVFVSNNCAFAYSNYWYWKGGGSDTTDFYQAFFAQSIKTVMNFNGVAAYSGDDNWSSKIENVTLTNPTTPSATRSYLVLWFNCWGYYAGVNNPTPSQQNQNNAFTAHDGQSVALIGSQGYNTQGPICAFVNSTYTLAIGSYCHDSVATSATINNHSAFWMDSAAPAIGTLPPGLYFKVYADDAKFLDSYLDIYTDATSAGPNGSMTARDLVATRMSLATTQTIIGELDSSLSTKPHSTACYIASLPPIPYVGQMCTFRDAASTSDCTTGGGTAVSTCVYNGTAWAKP